MPFLMLLQIVLIVLKLVGVATVAWAVILIPLWIALGIFAVVIFGLLIGASFAVALRNKF